jgi:alkanesulfonate monooxygenase SsuD/methylene tetrahydromethanopterin reductase-like flavin-dependent oxidoreductase (luciferase family)
VRSHGFRLQVGVDAPVPIHVGALGPRMCRLAGRVADGVLFFLMTPDGVRQALAEVHAGARAAGRDPARIEAFVRLPATMGEPEDLARFMARRLLTGYAIVPAYNASLARQGFAAEAGEIAGRWAAGERDRATEAFTDELLDATFLLGDADASKQRIQEYRDAGITTPVLMPLSVAGSPEERAERVTNLVEALAP